MDLFPLGPTLTDRDYFAAAALTAILTNSELLQSCVMVTEHDKVTVMSYTAEMAYRYADAMMLARKKS